MNAVNTGPSPTWKCNNVHVCNKRLFFACNNSPKIIAQL